MVLLQTRIIVAQGSEEALAQHGDRLAVAMAGVQHAGLIVVLPACDLPVWIGPLQKR
jgi:hypothetical protein